MTAQHWTVGCDPEVALRSKETGEFVSCEGLIPGDKLNPYKVKDGTIQVDGFAAEIGIEPASDVNQFCDRVESVLSQLRDRLPGYELVFTDSVIFSDEVYQAQSEKGRELGCEPDYNAYTKEVNDPPVPDPVSFRTFAGHVHIGWDKDMDILDPGHFADCISVAKQMDWSLGAPNAFWNQESKRRSLYGKAGSFRVKTYGMEYRTPDNTWLASRERMALMFNNTVRGMNDLYAGRHYIQRYACQAMIDGTNSYKAKNLGEYMAIMKIPYINPEKQVQKPPELKMKASKPRVRKPKVVMDIEAEINPPIFLLEQDRAALMNPFFDPAQRVRN